jgi:hypothetical protein
LTAAIAALLLLLGFCRLDGIAMGELRRVNRSDGLEQRAAYACESFAAFAGLAIVAAACAVAERRQKVSLAFFMTIMAGPTSPLEPSWHAMSNRIEASQDGASVTSFSTWS